MAGAVVLHDDAALRGGSGPVPGFLLYEFSRHRVDFADVLGHRPLAFGLRIINRGAPVDVFLWACYKMSGTEAI